MATAPPLSLSTVKQRYPRLFQQYTYLSEREDGVMDDLGDDFADLIGDRAAGPKTDPATGLRTFIMGNDFSVPLEDNSACPMKLESDANKFCMFLWKMLSACESGSVGGDACRQFDVLSGALDDTFASRSNTAKFEHLLGWTAAAANHQIDALLDRGDPDRNRALFKAAGDEWKKVFEANEKASFVSEDLRSFAKWQCGYFQQLLKQAKKEYGEHAKYTFNYVKKPRVKKPAPTMAPAASAAVTPPPTAVSAGTASSSTIIITKQSKYSKLGIGVGQEGARSKVTSIAPDSVFVGTDLRVGMFIDSINGHQITTWAAAVSLLASIEGNVTFVLSTAPAVAAAAASSSSAVSNQKENTAPAKSIFAQLPEVTGPWDDYGYVPVTKSGKQKSPNMIRNELQKYIDQCKADGARTQTSIIEEMGVNNNTFRRFMNPKTYKDQWSAVQNGTYLAAGRLLAKAKHQEAMAKKMAKKSGAAKRKAAAGDDNAAKKAKSGNENPAPSGVAGAGFPSKASKEGAIDLINRIQAVEGVGDGEVYDTCPQVVAKIKTFLTRDGMTKANLLRAFGNINSNSLGRFLSGKGQDQCGNVTYRAAYVFFEKLRILEGKSKTNARLKNEMEHPGGFSLVKSRAGKYFYFCP